MTRLATAPARLPAEQRREQILRCALHLFEQRPHTEVSTAEIADAAGVARPLIHHYFGTRRDLYIEVLRRHYFIPPIEPEELTGDTVDQRAGQLLDRWLADVARRPNMWMAFTATAGPGADPEVAAVLREAATLVARRLLGALGLDEDGPDGRRLARVIAWGGLARGAIDQWLVERTLTVGDVRTALVATLMTLLELPDASDER